MKTTISTLALALALAAPAAAQGLPAAIKEAGKVVVANQPNYPPMEYKDPATNTLKGLDIDLGTALAKELGVGIEWADIGFEQMVSSLNTGRVNMVESGMTDTPERRATLSFVDYMKTGAQFYTSADNKDDFKTMDAFCGHKVGMSKRTTFPAETAKWSAENCEAKGKPAIQVIGTEGSADARTQLKQGRIDGAVQGSETLPYLLSQEKGAYVIVGEPFTTQYQGIAFQKSDTALRDAYAAALAKLIASGEYKRIFDSYGLGVATVDKVRIDGELPK
jgi:polar amino acid transport system substrate-binding protein